MMEGSAVLAASPICCDVGPCVLVLCIRFSSTMFKVGAAYVFLQLADMSDLTNIVHCTLKLLRGFIS
jgi:hypothetical protein